MNAAEMVDGTGTTVRCPAGEFKGCPDNGTIQFLGIRYATSERFGAPTPYKYPDGVHEMATPCPMPIQLSTELGKLLAGPGLDSIPQEESCQYLSITVPEGPREGLPVMVWIHGGAFETCGCDMAASDRRPLVSECNVILVALGYRLGVLGFLKGRDGKLANNGILDLIEGARWVKENIASFGGDPDNITLFGESAGAEAVRCILLAEGTEDLYRRAIIQSDPIGIMTGRREMSEKMLEKLNLMPIDADIDEVKRVQSDIVSNTTTKGPQKFMKFGPNYGAYPLPEESEIPNRLKQIASGHDIIIGTTDREVAVFIGIKKIFVSMDKFFLTRWLIEAIVRSFTNKLFRNPSEDFAKQYVKCGGKAYVYRFGWMKDYDYIGACHTADLQLLFGSETLEGMLMAMGKKASETLEEGKPMRKMWTEFARSGEVKETEIKDVLTIKKIES